MDWIFLINFKIRRFFTGLHKSLGKQKDKTIQPT